MVRVAREHGLLMIDDLGSGCLLDVTQFGLAVEPTVQDSVEARVDLCLFSGDKLLGGPHAGIIAGRADLIERIERNPLARALRPDKGTIAGLHATLLHYVRGEALKEIPVWRMISMPVEAIEARANMWAQAIAEPTQVIDGRSMIGGGSLPEESLPTKLLAIPGEGGWLNAAAYRLRVGDPAIVARIDDGRLLLDPRTVPPAEDESLIEVMRVVIATRGES
jgi:L-seryl-tRNA(Ser) seleniumtransferase